MPSLQPSTELGPKTLDRNGGNYDYGALHTNEAIIVGSSAQLGISRQTLTTKLKSQDKNGE